MLPAVRFPIKSSLLSLAAAFALGSCDLLEFSPNDHRAPEDERQLTEKNLARLRQAPYRPATRCVSSSPATPSATTTMPTTWWPASTSSLVFPS
ncbi:hypothetical protein [Hymenobacter cellulosilyticus]|uniref:Uncharacterized protein n=1 Tax=Hymenobacter cellulosilyticus TaxID=2932248 RepID=A0A8T9QA70_9BACT|nr:hypothetical protein [Hymenobacter cellulosilyticus]UOQ73301.1 hypothetical protein MUN79_04870 [Hymenobacter cellulosilyticus]